ncbi:MAG: hypothetical protein JXA11_16530 [Phycisphaerae bacterium]|nr:hypothetical protein [Phycisphaerae bacterium]
MKPVLTDRMAVIGILAGLVLWVGCLTVLWGWAYDSAGSFSLRVLLSLFLTTWLCLWKRDRLVRVASRMLHWLHLHSWTPLTAALRHTLGSSKEDVRMRMRLLSVGAVVAVTGFVLSTLCIPLARLTAALLGEWFLLDDYTWRGIEAVTLLIGTLPAAVGLVCTLYASTVVRASGGRDTYASAYRDWLWGVALGCFAFAVSWWFGSNLIYLVFAVAGLILLAALTAVSRLELSTHPRKELLPFGPPSRGSVWRIAAAHGVLTVVLLIQMRLLGDVFSLNLTRRVLWVFLSLSLLGFFLSRIDRKGRPPGARQVSGAVIGLAAAMLAQSAEFILGGALDGGAGWMLLFAVATQIPIASLGAMVMSHQRRTFAQAGGTAGAYLAAGVGGLLTAVFVFLLLGSTCLGGWPLILSAGGMILAGGIDGARHSRGWAHRLEWMGWSIGLCATMLPAIFIALEQVVPSPREVHPGVWLTTLSRRDLALQQYHQDGVFPMAAPGRSNLVTRCLYEFREKDGRILDDGVFALRRGRWWIVSTAAEDLPPELPNRFYATGAQPEPPDRIRRYSYSPPLAYTAPEFFRYARLNFNAYQGCDYYDGVMLAPLPADHPQAWRCYNETVLRRCKRLTELRNPDGTDDYGLMVLRTQVGADHVRRALAVARTFHKAVRSGWAVVAVRRSGLDMLLMGPNEALEEKIIETENGPNVLMKDVVAALAKKLHKTHEDVYLVPIEKLWDVYSDVEPIRLANPPGERLAGTPPLDGLRKYLQLNRLLQRQKQSRSADIAASDGR